MGAECSCCPWNKTETVMQGKKGTLESKINYVQRTSKYDSNTLLTAYRPEEQKRELVESIPRKFQSTNKHLESTI